MAEKTTSLAKALCERPSPGITPVSLAIAPPRSKTMEAACREEVCREAAAVPETRLLGLWRHKGFFLMVLDAVTVASVFMLAYVFRFRWPAVGLKEVPIPGIMPYLHGAQLLAVIWVFFIRRERGYESGFMETESLWHRMRTVFISGLYALGFLMVISFWFRPLLLSRQVYLMTWVMALMVMYLARLLFRAIDQDLAGQGMVSHRILLAGLNLQAAEFAALLSKGPTLLKIVGVVRTPGDREGPDHFENYPVLGSLAEIRAIHRRIPFDRLVLGGGTADRDDGFIEVLNFCESENIPLYTLPNRFHIAVDQREVGSLSGLPMILMQDAAKRPGYAIVKRLLDIVIAAAALVGGLPFWIAIAVMIKRCDRGPVFYVQERAGLHGRSFRMIKFRSMVAGADARLGDLLDLAALSEPVFKIQNDPRVTPLGRFLRCTGLDEIPQLINVLKGEMSLVGPRPEEIAVVAHYTPWQRRRLKAVPGITGHQQIHNRGEPDLAKRVAFDLIYIKHQGLLLDLYILFKTVKVILFGKGITH